MITGVYQTHSRFAQIAGVGQFLESSAAQLVVSPYCERTYARCVQ